MINIFEDRKNTLSSIELTDAQKTVLAKAVLVGALNEPARVSLRTDQLVAARDILDELGIIEYSYEDNTITIDEESVELLKMEGIIDDSQQLTQEAQALVQNSSVTEWVSFKSFLNSDLLFLD
jgi:hypothetical protein